METKNKEINSISLERLNNGAHYQFISSIIKRAENHLSVSKKAETYVTALKTAFEKEDEYLKISQKSLITDEITAADAKRGKLYYAYNKTVKGLVNYPVEDIAQAAKELNQHIIDYGILPTMQLDQESGLLANFIQDLEGKYKEQVAKLSIPAFVTAMKESNDLVISLSEKRTEQRMTQNIGVLKEARVKCDEAYKQLVKMVNALILVHDTTEYDDFADYVNTQITHYKREAMGTKTTPSKTTTKPGTTNGGNGTTGNTGGTGTEGSGSEGGTNKGDGGSSSGSGNTGSTGNTGSSGSGSNGSTDGDGGLV